MKNLKNIILKAGVIVLGLSPFISNAQWNYSGTSGNQTIYNSGTGNLGIGTSSPLAKCHIDIGSGGTNTVATLIFGSSGNINFTSPTGTSQKTATLVVGTNWDDNSGSSGNIVNFYNSNGSKFLVRADGNIGIGTATPRVKLEVNGPVIIGTTTPTGINPGTGYMLAVAGKIYAQEVDVTPSTSWSDYVFKSDYKLSSLKEVEEHIKAKGHLKDVPSAEQVAKSGYKVGEMDATLLRKIEELTLYLLEQDKKYQVQQKEIESLKAQLGNK